MLPRYPMWTPPSRRKGLQLVWSDVRSAWRNSLHFCTAIVPPCTEARQLPSVTHGNSSLLKLASKIDVDIYDLVSFESKKFGISDLLTRVELQHIADDGFRTLF